WGSCGRWGSRSPRGEVAGIEGKSHRLGGRASLGGARGRQNLEFAGGRGPLRRLPVGSRRSQLSSGSVVPTQDLDVTSRDPASDKVEFFRRADRDVENPTLDVGTAI